MYPVNLNRTLFQNIGLVIFSLMASNASALVETAAVLPPSLKTVVVPEPANLSQFIQNKAAAIALGKAFFWDMQVGSDGQACASCHFHAGVDHRSKNQINPGAANSNGSISFDLTSSQTLTKPLPKAGPNYQLTTGDFPFHSLVDPFDRNSVVQFDSNDVVGSQGVFKRAFTKLDAYGKESCQSQVGQFKVGSISVRQVTGRNAPSVINSVYNFRNFWDGRANNRFNGLNPFGDRQPYDPKSTNNIVTYNAVLGTFQPIHVQLDDASLASQAVGPALSSGEMTCSGMQFRLLGRKLLPVIALKNQTVDLKDSVLGSYASSTGKGLKSGYTYTQMIQNAFRPELWNASKKFNTYTQMEQNFSLFWGLAIQLYEATLISDNSPYDQFMENPASFPLTAQQINGLNLFAGKGNCIACHRGAEFTAASKAHVTENFVERMLLNNSAVALYDTGFYNIGVRPTVEDLGLGGADPTGNPLSFTRQALKVADGMLDLIHLTLDPVTIDSWNFLVYTGTPIAPQEQDSIDGAFKTPGLRNIELTGPYFHNGGYGTLKQAMVFYNRGGDRRDTTLGDTSGYGANASNLSPNLAGQIDPFQPGIVFPTLGLQDTEMNDLVEFLKTLTDERVRWEKAPFDHPSLPLLSGHKGNTSSVTPSLTNPLEAQDVIQNIPAVGADGRAPKKLLPLSAF